MVWSAPWGELQVELIRALLTILIVAIAAYTDIRWSKIYNYLTLPAIVLGVVLSAVNNWPDGLWSSLAGIGIALMLFLFISVLGRILGGGDIKLLAAVGAMQGHVFLLQAIIYTALIGGVLAIIVALSRGILWQRVKRLFTSCYLRLVAQVPMDIETSAPVGSPTRLPYAIAISLGTLVTMLVVRA